LLSAHGLAIDASLTVPMAAMALGYVARFRLDCSRGLLSVWPSLWTLPLASFAAESSDVWPEQDGCPTCAVASMRRPA